MLLVYLLLNKTSSTSSKCAYSIIFVRGTTLKNPKFNDEQVIYFRPQIIIFQHNLLQTGST